MKKSISEKQMGGRIRSAINYLNQRGCYECPISAELAVVISLRMSKGIQRKSTQTLKDQIRVHLIVGERDVESEIRAAINNWLMGLQLKQCEKGGE